MQVDCKSDRARPGTFSPDLQFPSLLHPLSRCTVRLRLFFNADKIFRLLPTLNCPPPLIFSLSFSTSATARSLPNHPPSVHLLCTRGAHASVRPAMHFLSLLGLVFGLYLSSPLVRPCRSSYRGRGKREREREERAAAATQRECSFVLSFTHLFVRRGDETGEATGSDVGQRKGRNGAGFLIEFDSGSLRVKGGEGERKHG